MNTPDIEINVIEQFLDLVLNHARLFLILGLLLQRLQEGFDALSQGLFLLLQEDIPNIGVPILGRYEGIDITDIDVHGCLLAPPGDMQLHLLHVGVVDLDGEVEGVEDVLLQADVGDCYAAVEDTRFDVFLVDAVEKTVQIFVQDELYDEGHFGGKERGGELD